MASALPEGAPPPLDGALSAGALQHLGGKGFGIYIHIPFCASRCGYCDFNTYTPGELGGVADTSSYVDAVLRELELAQKVLGPGRPTVDTIFFGGGTPTLLPTDQLRRLLNAVGEAFGLSPDVEVTTEANPESVNAASLQELRAAGFTRISLGMQSAARQVLAVLERRHTPGRAVAAAREAAQAGFKHINLDLIYGTPGETDDDFRHSLDAAIGAGVNHVSAYALIVEDGTRLARQVKHGTMPAPDDDILADRYLMADQRLSEAGFSWYEVSNWSRSDDGQCRHNMIYWRGGDWWGLGPGAHSHVGGVRWWNVKHPARYAAVLSERRSPAAGRETLDDTAQKLESLLLGVRLKRGLSTIDLNPLQRDIVAKAHAGGLFVTPSGELELTVQGRLVADRIVRDLATEQ